MGEMSFCVADDYEKYIKFRIPFTVYWLFRNPDTKLWSIVEKEFDHHSGKYYFRYI
jgi:hypothetical protein